MNQFDPQLVESLFQDALELEPAERRDYLDRNCADDAALRAEVENLIRAFARADRRASWNAGALFNEAGRGLMTHLDRYEIQERIGTGGMGSVYKALRKEGDFTKVVAVTCDDRVVHITCQGEPFLRSSSQRYSVLSSAERTITA
jgi:eukaryotic-like serine/threonine-protein kinase